MKIYGIIFKEKVNQSVFKLGKKKYENNVLEIKFNKYGIVESKKLYQINNMNDLKVEKNLTQKKYQRNSATIKALNSFSKN